MHSHVDILLTSFTAYLNSCPLTKKQHHWMQSHERGDCWQTLLFTKTAGNKVAEFINAIPQTTAVQTLKFDTNLCKLQLT